MRTHVALLRGINVGGRNKVAMADLRKVVAEVGHRDVATYIQSGNVVFAAGSPAEPDHLADELEGAIAAATGVTPAVVVLPREALVAAAAANPFPEEIDPKRLHAVFYRHPLSADEQAAVAAAQARAADKGSRDEAAVRGAVTYLRTPDGMGRSELAAQLARAKVPPGTARNWATVTTLLGLLDG